MVLENWSDLALASLVGYLCGDSQGRITHSILTLKAQILRFSSEIVLVKIRYLDGFREEWLLLHFKICPAG